MSETNDLARPAHPSFWEAFVYWLKLGFISFGGPAGQISIMHQELVEKRRWISERRFLHALNYCMVLPGPEAQQLAIYIGWLLHRTWGGIVAGVLFVLPSLFILAGLTYVYLAFGDVKFVQGVFNGIKPAVVAIVVFAAWRIGSRALKNKLLWAMAAASFVAIFALKIDFPYIVLGAGLLGFIGGKFMPEKFRVGGGHGASNKSFGPALIDDDTPPPAHVKFNAARLAITAAGRTGLVGRGDDVVDRAHSARHGRVLHQGRAGHLRRRLRGVALRLSGRGGAIPLAHRHADDRRPGAGRNHAGAADHGGVFRRFRGRVDEADFRPGSPVPGRLRRCQRGDFLHLSAFLPVHPGGRAAGRSPPMATSSSPRR